MKIWHVIKHYFLYSIRMPISLIMMIIFPIILLTILSFAFKNSFVNTPRFSTLNIEYNVNTKDKNVDKAFLEYIDLLHDKLDINFVKSNNFDESKERVENKNINAFINFDDSKKIDIYKNDADKLNSTLLESLINTYFEKGKIINTIIKDYPQSIQTININNDVDYVIDIGINAKKGITSSDYYSIAIIVQMGLYASLSAIFAVYNQKRLDTLKRIGLSGMGIGKFMTGTIIGNILVGALQLFIIYLYSILVLGANWGSNLVAILLVFLSLLFFSTSIGVSIGIAVKNEVVASVLPQIVIPFFAIVGGAYFPIEIFLSYISPIYWTNKAISVLAYGGNGNYVWIALIINIAIGLFFYIFAVLKGRKVVFS